ncbi:transposase, MuDR, MULE transposase domain protein [Tanacetum coccineum]
MFLTRAHCPANRYNYMTSNCAESINALTKTVRKVPITMLMDYYRDLIQRWYFERRYTGEDEPAVDELSRFAVEKVRHRMLKSVTWTVYGVDRFRVYQVRDNKRFHLVDLAKRECSCRKWKLSVLPCGHVCALSRCLGMTNCNRWAKAWFSKRTLKVLPPALVKPQPGRPKNKDRIGSQGEDPIINRCFRCDTMGHHRDACHSSVPSQVTKTNQWIGHNLSNIIIPRLQRSIPKGLNMWYQSLVALDLGSTRCRVAVHDVLEGHKTIQSGRLYKWDGPVINSLQDTSGQIKVLLLELAEEIEPEKEREKQDHLLKALQKINLASSIR